jgi:hypothetical protein
VLGSQQGEQRILNVDPPAITACSGVETSDKSWWSLQIFYLIVPLVTSVPERYRAMFGLFVSEA